MIRRSIVALWMAVLALAACAPAPVAPALTTTATPSPSPTRTVPTPQPGRWLGTVFGSQQPEQPLPPMQFMFDVADDGTLSGSASFYPTHVPEKARELVNQKGCLLHFDSLTSEDGRIKGQFLTNRDAAIILRAEDCTVKFFGDILLDEPITGTWLVSYSEGATLALKQAANQPLTPLERGMAVFLNQCSACHGISGEGSPGIPSLNTENVRKRTDEELLEIINNGVFNTTMPAWGAVLTEEDKAGLLVLLHDLRVLW